MLSYVVADLLDTSAAPVLAPLTAILVVQLTMYETFRHGLERILSVLAGVLVAIGLASVVGLTWWSLGAVVALSLVVGRVLRLGPHLLEVPISAMLVLAVTNAEDVAIERVYETLIGSAVGVLVNLVIAPPLYMQPAGDALAELADRTAGVLRGLAGQLRQGWSRSAADHWLEEARALGAEVARADETLARAEQSARLNPRGRAVRRVQPRLRAALTGLEHVHVSLRGLARGLLDRTYYVPVQEQEQAYSPDARHALADVLEKAAEAVWEIGEVARASRPEGARRRMERQLAELERLQARLSRLLAVDPAADQGAWQQHGALLAAIDRLRVEIAAAVRPADKEWHPPPLAARRGGFGRRLLSGRGRRAR